MHSTPEDNASAAAEGDSDTTDLSSYSLIDPDLPPEIRAQLLVEQVIRRRSAGEVISDEQLLARYPELLGTLEKQLRKAAVVQVARSTAIQEQNGLEDLIERFDADPELSDSQDLPDQLAARLAGQSSANSDEKPECDAIAESVDEAEIESDQVQSSVDNGRITIDEFFSEEHDREASGRKLQELTRQRADQATQGNATLCELDSHHESLAGRSELSATDGQAIQYRPVSRPPTAVLKVYDDDQVGSELFRLRTARTVLGRVRGEVVLPHDNLMSGEHAAIERTNADGKWKWTLRDLNSTNGIYVKARKIRLRMGDQLLIAGQAVQFLPGEGDGPPVLQQARPDSSGDPLVLTDAEYWIGRDQAMCSPFMSNESMLDARFARLLRRKDGRWTIWADRTLNGLWIRVDHVDLAAGSMFQLGEQRFGFHLP